MKNGKEEQSGTGALAQRFGGGVATGKRAAMEKLVAEMRAEGKTVKVLEPEKFFRRGVVEGVRDWVREMFCGTPVVIDEAMGAEKMDRVGAELAKEVQRNTQSEGSGGGKIVSREREILQAALDWDAEYRSINNLGSGRPHWVSWAWADLNMTGHYDAEAGRNRAAVGGVDGDAPGEARGGRGVGHS